MATALVYDDRFLKHDTGKGHPERPDRLRAVMDKLRSTGLAGRMTKLPFEPAGLEPIRRIHDEAYITRLHQACQTGQSHVDCADSAISAQSYDVALVAVGGVLAAVDAVMSAEPTEPGGRIDNAFCAVRPPGHHAEHDRSMGFCLFNNVAIAAQHLIDRHALKRVAIVDFDVHHGNGTQHSFQRRDDVLFISLHEHPDHLYPGTGYAHETGQGPGEGYTINLPLMPQQGDEVYHHAFQTRVIPALDEYKPQFLLVSAGFDAASADPLAHMLVSADGFEWMSRQLKSAAQRLCGGRLLSTLEGGYDLKALAEAAARHVEVWLG